MNNVDAITKHLTKDTIEVYIRRRSQHNSMQHALRTEVLRAAASSVMASTIGVDIIKRGVQYTTSTLNLRIPQNEQAVLAAYGVCVANKPHLYFSCLNLDLAGAGGYTNSVLRKLSELNCPHELLHLPRIIDADMTSARERWLLDTRTVKTHIESIRDAFFVGRRDDLTDKSPVRQWEDAYPELRGQLKIHGGS